jgi:hypothetical protein
MTMEMRSRRGILKNAATAAAAVFGGTMTRKASAEATSMQKRNATQLPGVIHEGAPLPFTSVVGFGNSGRELAWSNRFSKMAARSARP